MLRKIFNFFAEARQSKIRNYHDYYARESVKQDDKSNGELFDMIDKDAWIRIYDVNKAINSLKHRTAYSLSPEDMTDFVHPVFSEIVRQVEKGAVPCHVRPEDNVFAEGFVQTKDFLGILGAYFSPERDAEAAIKSVCKVPVPVDPDFGDSATGQWRQKFYNAFPLRTPSAPVRYEKEQTGKEIDIRRVFLLAIGYAADHNKYIDDIPLYSETKQERAEITEKRKQARRRYRGQDY